VCEPCSSDLRTASNASIVNRFRGINLISGSNSIVNRFRSINTSKPLLIIIARTLVCFVLELLIIQEFFFVVVEFSSIISRSLLLHACRTATSTDSLHNCVHTSHIVHVYVQAWGRARTHARMHIRACTHLCVTTLFFTRTTFAAQYCAVWAAMSAALSNMKPKNSQQMAQTL
jgi:hypothetical protein